jgi:Sap-like sulfolipid-1-addressing protein
VSLEALVLGFVSGLRPGTSLAAVIALLGTPEPRRPLLFFVLAGLAWSFAVGLLVVAVFHGAGGAFGRSTFRAVLDVAFGAAALGFAAGLQQGWVQPRRRTTSSSSDSAEASQISRRLRDPSVAVAAAAGVGTHLPGLIYLVALTSIASEDPGLVSAGGQVAIYDALWFSVPLASLVLVMVRPGAADAYLTAATAWVRRNEHAVLVIGSFVLGAYFIVKGATNLLT